MFIHFSFGATEQLKDMKQEFMKQEEQLREVKKNSTTLERKLEYERYVKPISLVGLCDFSCRFENVTVSATCKSESMCTKIGFNVCIQITNILYLRIITIATIASEVIFASFIM